MRSPRLSVSLLAIATAFGACGSQCQRNAHPQGTYPPQPTYAPYPPPQPTYYPQPPPTYAPTYPQPQPQPQPQPTSPPPQPTAAPGPMVAPGLPCVSDNDFTCTFGRCIQGRCGGCTSNADCKPGAICANTLFGQACLYAPGRPGPAPGPAPGPGPSPSTDPFANARQACVDRVNGYRARVNAAPLARRTDREACIDGQALSDAQANRAHASFGKCEEGSQNECPGYPGTPEAVVAQCLEQMWNEGPGEPYSAHGHYINMTGPYRGVACGFHQTADGKIWLVQDFYR